MKISYPFDGRALEEIGLIKENTNKTFDFRCFSLRVECQELSDRSLEFRRFYEFTPSGRSLAHIVVPKIAKFTKFTHRQQPDTMKRFSTFYSDHYSTLRDRAESLVIPAAKKKDLAVGQIIHFLIEKNVAIRIKKTIYEKHGQHNVHKSGNVLVLHGTMNKKTKIQKFVGGPHWKAMSQVETEFIEDVIAHVKANES